MHRFSMILVAMLFATAAGAARSQTLTGEEISSLITGKKVLLATRWGSFPLRYQANSQVVGDGSALGLAKFFAPKETGKWWIASEQLCQQFPTWYKGKAFCFTIDQQSPNEIRWTRDDGFAGTATISQ